MTNIEHAFENLLVNYIQGEGDFVERWKANDKNLKYLTNDQIDTIYECGIYILSDLFCWDKEAFRKIFQEDEYD